MNKSILPKFKEIDLTDGHGHHHPDIIPGRRYLIRHSDNLYLGYFTREWYGLNFSGIYPAGCQYDKPGTNSSEWQAVWEMNDAL